MYYAIILDGKDSYTKEFDTRDRAEEFAVRIIKNPNFKNDNLCVWIHPAKEKLNAKNNSDNKTPEQE